MSNVTLREKALKDNKKRLYLDFYPPIPNPSTGKPTRRKFLDLFIYVPESRSKRLTATQKQHNSDVKIMAEEVRAKTQLEVLKGKYQFLDRKGQEMNFVDYFEQLMNKRKGSNHDNWVCALYYFKQFSGGHVAMKNVTAKLGNEYREWIRTAQSKKEAVGTISQNTQVAYFNKFKATLKSAFKEGLLTEDINGRIPSIPQQETTPEFLTQEEFQALYQTECFNPLVKRAAIFQCLTGMRFSDVNKMTWSEIREVTGDGWQVAFRQKKTGNVEWLPISEQARSFLGETGDSDDRVFKGLKYSCYTNVHLKMWGANAGIKKNLHFHMFRHTFAVLQLIGGTDLYTLSKMLGHREIRTTQIYAQVVNELKRKAADVVKLNITTPNDE